MNQWDPGHGASARVSFAFPPLTPMVKRLILANFAAFIVFVLLGFAGPDRLGAVKWLTLYRDVWAQAFPLVPVWQVLTYGFLHDPLSLGHLAFNMLTLYFFGGSVEAEIGGRRFLVHYLAAVVVAALVHLLGAPLIQGGGPVLGASGACLAMIVAAAVLRPNSTVYLIIVPVRLWVLAVLLVGLDVFSLVIELQGFRRDDVALLVHLGGAAYGYLAARRRWLWIDPLDVLERKRAVAQEERRVSDDVRLDQLLARIKREGLGSLSAADREFLKRQSERGR